MAIKPQVGNVYVDFGRTFGRAIFLGCEPKMGRVDRNDNNSQQVHQRNDKTGKYKYTVGLAVKVTSFEQKKNVTLNVTVESATEPFGNIDLGEVVTPVGLQMGNMGDGGVYWSAEDIVPADAVPATAPVTSSGQRVVTSSN